MNKAQVVTFCLPCMPLLFNEIILNPYLQEFSYPKNPKMYVCDTILVTVLKMQPHYGQSSCENSTPSSVTSPLASYKEVPFHTRGRGQI